MEVKGLHEQVDRRTKDQLKDKKNKTCRKV